MIYTDQGPPARWKDIIYALCAYAMVIAIGAFVVWMSDMANERHRGMAEFRAIVAIQDRYFAVDPVTRDGNSLVRKYRVDDAPGVITDSTPGAPGLLIPSDDPDIGAVIRSTQDALVSLRSRISNIDVGPISAAGGAAQKVTVHADLLVSQAHIDRCQVTLTSNDDSDWMAVDTRCIQRS